MKKIFSIIAAMLFAGSMMAGPTSYPKKVAAPEADAHVYAYGLSVTEEGDNYNFAYTCNVNAVAGKLVFYNAETHVKVGFIALTDVTAGSHTSTVAKADLPAEGNLNWAIELEGGNITAFKNVHTGAARSGRGQLVVNTIPESDFFGNIYYTNRTGNTNGGLYVYGPDYQQIGDLYTLGETAAWGSQKLSIDAKGNLWLPDWTDGHSGVYFVNPADLTTCSQVFQGTRASSGLFQNNGEDVGGSCVVAHIYGEGENTQLMTIDEDMTGYAHSLMIYNIGEAHTWSAAPSKKIKISDNAGQVFSIAAIENGVWLCQSRANGSNTSGARSLMFYDYNGNRKYVSDDATFISGSMGGGIALDKDGKIYMPDATGNILILTPTYGDSAVTLTKETVACGFTMISSMFFDYAGNLVITGSNSGSYNNSASFQLAVFALPTTENVCETPAKKALIVSKPAPVATDYYIKNNWNGAVDWTWEKMTAAEGNTYTFTGVYGGTGVNINTTQDDATATWFGEEAAWGVQALDTVAFTYNATDSTLAVALVGRPAPAPVDYYIKNNWNGAADWTWEKMTAAEGNTYTFTGVYGGTGVNINTTQVDATATWFGEETAWGVQALDTVAFTYNATDSTLAVALVGRPVAPEVINYYLVGTASEGGWNAGAAMPLHGDSIVRHLVAGSYEFRLLSTLGQWDQKMGYAQINTECSSQGYTAGNDNNIKITLNADGDVKIKVVNNQICLTGAFGAAVITSYTIAGSAALLGVEWDAAAVANDMVENDGTWTLVLNNVELTAATYEYKVVGNHNWDVFAYPSANATLAIEAAGTYNVTFTWVPATPSLTAVAELVTPTAIEEVAAQEDVQKVFLNGTLYIRKAGVLYTTGGARVE